MRTKLAALCLAIMTMSVVISGCDAGTSYSNAFDSGQTQDTQVERAYDNESIGLYKAASSNDEAVAEDADVVATEDEATTESAAQNTTAQNTEQKIVYSGDISLETTDYEKTVEELKSLMQQTGAMISNSSETDNNDFWYASDAQHRASRHIYWQLRVPSKKFNEFFDSVGNVTGSVRSKNTYSSDMTKTYSDTKVQIEALTVQQNNLLKMMETAETIEDMLAIEDRLTEVRENLYRLNSANNQIDYDVQYSTVSLSVTEVHEYQEEEPETFIERLVKSFDESASGFIKFVQDCIIALIYLLPFLLILAVVLSILFAIGRRTGRKVTGSKFYHQPKKQGNDTPNTEEAEERSEKE